MKKLLLLISVLILTVNCKSVSSFTEIQAKFEKISKEIKSEYAPDRREKVYEPKIDVLSDSVTLVLRGATTEMKAKEALIEALKAANISVLDSMVVLPDADLGDKTYGITAQSVINFRYGPGYSNESATQTILGTPMRILEKKSGWIRAITPEGYIAWVSSGSIQPMNEQEYMDWTLAPKLIVTTHYALFREQPSDSSPVVMDAVMGNIVRHNGESGTFYKVILPTGKSAFISKAYATDYKSWLDSRNPTPENLVAAGKQMLGFPYMWGGTSIKAIDCSGFVKTAYYLNGIILERDASQQALTGDKVDISKGFDNLKMGDLLFFGTKADGDKKERITHVGMYISNGEFIHSASSVKINSLLPEASNYSDVATKLVRAQRILTKVDIDSGIVSIKKHPWYFPSK